MDNKKIEADRLKAVIARTEKSIALKKQIILDQTEFIKRLKKQLHEIEAEKE